MAAAKRKTIGVENVIRPGRVTQVDAEKYEAMKGAFLKIIPKKAPGATPAEILKRVVAHLPEQLYPGGATARRRDGGLVGEGGATRPGGEGGHRTRAQAAGAPASVVTAAALNTPSRVRPGFSPCSASMTEPTTPPVIPEAEALRRGYRRSRPKFGACLPDSRSALRLAEMTPVAIAGPPSMPGVPAAWCIGSRSTAGLRWLSGGVPCRHTQQ